VPPLYILMYHRVCAYTPDTACYFERGTAVTPEVFLRQIEWFGRRMKFVTLTDALQKIQLGDNKYPLCVLTFDDGYQDSLLYATQYPLTLFPIANHLADHQTLMFIDHYYALLHHAQRRKDINLSHLLPNIIEYPSIDKNLCWWVKGPVKQYLQTLPIKQKIGFLTQLGEYLIVQKTPRNQELYLSQQTLQQLACSGHQIGGHGQTHQRLTTLNLNELCAELTAAYHLVKVCHSKSPIAFCYPDGAYNKQVIEAVKQVGFNYACSVESGFWSADMKTLFNLPRFFMRNEWDEKNYL